MISCCCQHVWYNDALELLWLIRAWSHCCLRYVSMGIELRKIAWIQLLKRLSKYSWFDWLIIIIILMETNSSVNNHRNRSNIGDVRFCWSCLLPRLLMRWMLKRWLRSLWPSSLHRPLNIQPQVAPFICCNSNNGQKIHVTYVLQLCTMLGNFVIASGYHIKLALFMLKKTGWCVTPSKKQTHAGDLCWSKSIIFQNKLILVILSYLLVDYVHLTVRPFSSRVLHQSKRSTVAPSEGLLQRRCTVTLHTSQHMNWRDNSSVAVNVLIAANIMHIATPCYRCCSKCISVWQCCCNTSCMCVCSTFKPVPFAGNICCSFPRVHGQLL